MTRFFLDRAIRFATLLLILSAAGILAYAREPNPVIIIPGIMGSELVNKQTGETVWLSVARSKVDDIRLPVVADPLSSRDGLVAGDILRSVKVGVLPRVDLYQGLIDALKTRGGYHEEKWIEPTANGDKGGIYVFAYDWRLDNVQNARLLVQKIDALKKTLGKPDLKFDVIAHSMGGLIVRYAAMYGDADLPAAGRKPTPTWAGAKDLRKIVLLGTPNEGSSLALEGFINGESFGPIGVNLPFVRNVSRFDIFTIPAAYELLPAPGTFKLYGPDAERIDVDLYDPKVWTEYGWNPIDDRKFDQSFSAVERKTAPRFFEKMLKRARLFHEALDAGTKAKPAIELELVGSECKQTVDAALVRPNDGADKWVTLFKVDGSAKRRSDDRETAELKAAIYTPGDGVVTASSLVAAGRLGVEPLSTIFVCEGHNSLPGNAEVQDHLIEIFKSQS